MNQPVSRRRLLKGVGAGIALPLLEGMLPLIERVIGGIGIEEYWRKLLKRSGQPLDNELAKLRASQIFDLARQLIEFFFRGGVLSAGYGRVTCSRQCEGDQQNSFHAMSAFRRCGFKEPMSPGGWYPSIP